MSAPQNRADVVALMAETIIAMRDCEPAAVALAVLAQQEAAGLRVVPVVLTLRQKERVRDNGGETAVAWATAAWPDLLAASPCAPPQEHETTDGA